MEETVQITGPIPDVTPANVAAQTPVALETSVAQTTVAPETPAQQTADAGKQQALSIGSFYDDAPAIQGGTQTAPVSFYQKANERFKSTFTSDDDAIAEIDQLRKKREEAEAQLSQKRTHEFSSDVLAAADYLLHTNRPADEVNQFLNYANTSFYDKNPNGSLKIPNVNMVWHAYTRYCQDDGKEATAAGFEVYKKDLFGRYNPDTMETEINEHSLAIAASQEREYAERLRKQIVEDTLKQANTGRAELDKTRVKKSELLTSFSNAYTSYVKNAPEAINDIPVQGIGRLRASVSDKISKGTLLQSWVAPNGVVLPDQLKMIEVAEIIMNPSMPASEKKKLVDHYFTGMVGAEAERSKKELLASALSTGATNTTGQRDVKTKARVINDIEEIRSMGPIGISDTAFQK